MVPEIVSVMQGLQAASEVAKAVLGMKVSAEVNLHTSELLRLLRAAEASGLAAERETTALVRRVRELEDAELQRDEWEAEKARYKLTEFRPGAFVYTAKEPHELGHDALHDVCPNCFSDKKKTVLQTVKGRHATSRPGYWLICSRCDFGVHK